MPTLHIENFGPIKQLDLEIKDILFFIGPQASGKSSVSKLIFFFKLVEEELFKSVSDINTFVPSDTSSAAKRSILGASKLPDIESFSRNVNKRFFDLFGSLKHVDVFEVTYNYTDENAATVSLEHGTARIEFNQPMLERLKAIFSYAVDSGKKIASYKTPSSASKKRKEYSAYIEQAIYDIFQDSHAYAFIPAARSLVSTLAGQMERIDITELDLSTCLFVDTILSLKKLFENGMDGFISYKREFSDAQIDEEMLSLAVSITRQILKGEYRSDTDGEKIFLSPTNYVYVNHASSGQQEVLWILHFILNAILEPTNLFSVFEEPEAHLFPEAQNDIVKLIALLANTNSNQVIVTTHSPYILSAFNNLLYAHQLGQDKPEAVAEIIERKAWINPDRVAAYFVENGSARSIMDDELQQIKAEEIDGASSTSNEIYDKLYYLD